MKISGDLFWNILKILEQELTRGAHQPPTRAGARPPPQAAPPGLVGALSGSSPDVLWLYTPICPRKKIREHFRDFPPPSRGGTRAGALLLSGGAIPPGKLPSGRGKSKPSSSPTFLSSWEASSSSTSSSAPSHLQTLVHLLYSIFVSNLRLVPGGASSVDYIL